MRIAALESGVVVEAPIVANHVANGKALVVRTSVHRLFPRRAAKAAFSITNTQNAKVCQGCCFQLNCIRIACGAGFSLWVLVAKTPRHGSTKPTGLKPAPHRS